MTGDAPATLVWIAAGPARRRGGAGARELGARARRDAAPPGRRAPAGHSRSNPASPTRSRTSSTGRATRRRRARATRSIARRGPPRTCCARTPSCRRRRGSWPRSSARDRRAGGASTPPTPRRPSATWVRAEALDGGRMPGLGETSAGVAIRRTREVTLARPGRRRGCGSTDEAVPGERRRRDARRPARARRDARTALRSGPGGSRSRPGSSTFEIDAPCAAPCSSADAARAAAGGRDAAGRAGPVRAVGRRRARTRAGVAPDRHVRGRPLRPSPRVARRRSRGPDRGRPSVAEADAGHARHWPAWATWVARGRGRGRRRRRGGRGFRGAPGRRRPRPASSAAD